MNGVALCTRPLAIASMNCMAQSVQLRLQLSSEVSDSLFYMRYSEDMAKTI